MTIPANRIKALREQRSMTQDELARHLQMNRANISNYERGVITNIPGEVLSKMADLFGTSVDYVIGRSDDRSATASTADDAATRQPAMRPSLTTREERDIAKGLQTLLNDLQSEEALAFHGEPLNEESKQLLRISLEHSMKLAKQLAKRKFTPHKYRN